MIDEMNAVLDELEGLRPTAAGSSLATDDDRSRMAALLDRLGTYLALRQSSGLMARFSSPK